VTAAGWACQLSRLLGQVLRGCEELWVQLAAGESDNLGATAAVGLLSSELHDRVLLFEFAQV
jgi:hypothetical protein